MLGCLLLLASAAVVAAILHERTTDPHSGLHDPDSDSVELNRRAQRRSTEFIDALSRGDVVRMKAMADTADDEAAVDAFEKAFGGRHLMIIGMDDSGFAESVVFTHISVPCRDGSTQKAFVGVVWKQTSFFSSDWFAFLHPPGERGIQPAGCPAP